MAAAATLLPVRSRSMLAKSVVAPAQWQAESLDFFDTTPELKYVGWWVGNLLSKVKLYVAIENEDGEAVAVDAVKRTKDPETGVEKVERLTEVPEAVAKRAVAELTRLRGAMGGQSELQREMGINLDFAGECYLVGWGAREEFIDPSGDPAKNRPATPESWEIRSISEVEFKDGKTKIKGSSDDKDVRTLDPELDTIIRCWQRHPRWSKLADSHVRATLSQCRLLQVLEGQILAEAMSRHNAGILLVNQNTTWASTKTAGTEEQKEGEDPFTAGLTEMITAPVADPSDPSSIVPNVAKVDDVEKAMKWIPLGRDSNETLDKRITARLERLAGGLNVPKEVVLGHRNTTFDNAAQISDDEFTDHLEPRVLLQCDILTVGFLRPQLTDPQDTDAATREWAPRMFVWYDASALLDAPDRSEAADDAYDRGAIGPASYREAKGFTEDDAPTVPEQLAMLAIKRSILTAELSAALIKRLDPTFVVEPIEAAAPAEGESTEGDDAEMRVLMAALGPAVARAALLAACGLSLEQTSRRQPVIRELPASTAGPPGNA